MMMPSRLDDPQSSIRGRILTRGAAKTLAGAALVALLTLLAYTTGWTAVCRDCGGGDDGGGGGGDPVVLPVPDAAFQFKGCLPAPLVSYLQQKIAAQITAALKRAGEENPLPDLRALCADGRQTVAVWFKPVGDYGADDSDAARDAEVQKVDLLTGNERGAVLITAKGVDRQVAAQFAKRRHLDEAGKANPAGPVHLDEYGIQYISGNSPSPATPRYLRTTIEGHYEVPVFPDVGFTVDTLDALWLSGGKVQCNSETEYDIHTLLVDVMQFLTVLLGQIVTPQSVFLVEGFLIFDNTGNLPTQAGPGCLLAAAIPSEIMIPGTRLINVGGFVRKIAYKLDMHYTRLDVNVNGITAAGNFTQVVRRPSLDIVGPASPIRIEFGTGQLTARFKLRPHDLRDVEFVVDDFEDENPDVIWNVPGATVTHPPYCRVTTSTGDDCIDWGRNWKEATITWNINPSTPIGTILIKSFGVNVVDADGLSAQAGRLLRFTITRDPDLPPICDKHPERVECDPVE